VAIYYILPGVIVRGAQQKHPVYYTCITGLVHDAKNMRETITCYTAWEYSNSECNEPGLWEDSDWFIRYMYMHGMSAAWQQFNHCTWCGSHCGCKLAEAIEAQQ